eukprot:TRINITY_DN27250_c0_g1_i1.p1 TRINITY_DN27250_c0_g1~~TRINITY_DN27250_c0_g1_i1.p1  ORF type:complete len:317 (-),score=54.39 TRINITY_DN27250_c0_g1_i1:592-1542(-)
MDGHKEHPCDIYIGGLSTETTDERLRAAFGDFGTITSVTLITDRETQQKRGFGFISFSNPREAMDAIKGMDGEVVDGRTLRVMEVLKKEDREAHRREMYNRGPPAYRDRDRGHGRRSPGPGPGRGRGRSPGYRRSYSPRRSPRRMSSGGGGRSRSPYSRSPTPERRSDRPDSGHMRPSENRSREKIAAPDDEEEELQAREYEAELRDAVEGATQDRAELSNKIKTMVMSLATSTEKEAELVLRVSKLETTSKEAAGLCMLRTRVLKEMEGAVVRLREAEEQRKEGERALKTLSASLPADLLGPPDEGALPLLAAEG